MADEITVKQSPKQMAVGEAIAWTFDFANIGTPSSITSFLAYKGSTDASSTTLSGSASISGSTVIGKLFTPTETGDYRLIATAVISGNTVLGILDVAVDYKYLSTTSLATNSYGALADVLSFTRHLLDGQPAFSLLTRPTNTEVKNMMDRLSGLLNSALSGVGLTIPVTQADAKLACDDWVIMQAVAYVELTQRGAGANESENARYAYFRNVHKSAAEFAMNNRLGFVNLGVGVTRAKSSGLQFTGITAPADRVDRDDTSIEQPFFVRRKWNDPSVGDTDEEDDE